MAGYGGSGGESRNDDSRDLIWFLKSPNSFHQIKVRFADQL